LHPIFLLYTTGCGPLKLGHSGLYVHDVAYNA